MTSQRSSRWLRSFVGTLMALITLGGAASCTAPASDPYADGEVRLRLGDIGLLTHSGIKCRQGPDEDVARFFLETRGPRWDPIHGEDRFEDWMIDRGHRVDLRLEVVPGQPREAYLEVAVDDSIYRATWDGSTRMISRWDAGRVTFRDAPLASGEPIRGRRELDRVFIRWECEPY